MSTSLRPIVRLSTEDSGHYAEQTVPAKIAVAGPYRRMMIILLAFRPAVTSECTPFTSSPLLLRQARDGDNPPERPERKRTKVVQLHVFQLKCRAPRTLFTTKKRQNEEDLESRNAANG